MESLKISNNVIFKDSQSVRKIVKARIFKSEIFPKHQNFTPVLHMQCVMYNFANIFPKHQNFSKALMVISTIHNFGQNINFLIV